MCFNYSLVKTVVYMLRLICIGGQNTFLDYKGYFEQNLPKVALVVHFTIHQYLLTGAIL